MRLTVFLTCLGLTCARAEGLAQTVKVSLNLEKQTLSRAFDLLREQTNLVFFFSNREVDLREKVSGSFADTDLEEVLTRLLGNRYSFRIVDNMVLIRPVAQAREFSTVKGAVRDERNNPLPGVTVFIKGTTMGTATNREGIFLLPVPRDTVTLVFSFVGMETREVKLPAQGEEEERAPISIVMKEMAVAIDDVVVTGYANVRKTSFTGTAIQVSREDILNVSSGNLIDALQVFDPSLRVIRNDRMGSDPNTLPEFYIRGRSGVPNVKELDLIDAGSDVSRFALVNNPNLPVFIMDGFEVSVEKIYDFDINRIKDITILKDAAATALYGSRASNGVIVIETRSLRTGEFRVTYSGNFGLTAPDLSSYDMMNAKEAFAAEVDAGFFDVRPEDLATGQTYDWIKMVRDWEYQQKLNRILKGVDNYWLSQPLRTEFNQNHSVAVEGGEESIRFAIDLNYNNQNGVMKESFRDRIGAGLTFDYRYKGLMFKDQITFHQSRSENSPYGSFHDYSVRHPYDEWADADGNYVKTLPMWGLTMTSAEKNPLYEASVDNYDKTTYDEWVNNLSVNWTLDDHLYVRGQLAVSDKRTEGDVFTDPASALYSSIMTEWFMKGQKTLNKTRETGWNVNAFAAYSNTLWKSHYVNFSAGLNANASSAHHQTEHYTGFPDAKRHQVAYAYKMDSKPTYSDNKTRLFGTFAALNYSFEDIYLFDASYRVDGSSEFGSKRRWAPFWSTGAGINLHKYRFLQETGFVDQLKVKATYGLTGKLNVSPYASRHIFTLMLDQWYITGIGGRLMGLGNESLTWEKMRTWDVGLETSLWKRRIYFRFNWYDKLTRDLISSMPLPASSGFESYMDNIGRVRNRGVELYLNLRVFSSKDWDVMLSGNMASNKNKILEISQNLKDYNERVNNFYDAYRYSSTASLPNMLAGVDNNIKYAQPVMKYEAGNSLTSIYGMESLGINPADGKEIFLRRDGTITYTWSSTETHKIGDSEPLAQGTLALNARFKNFTLYTTFLYEMGGDKYNQTLVNNVENVNLFKFNADRRVMRDRWKQPGDVTQLKALQDRYDITRPTSRFVQEDNTLKFNSMTLGYDLDKQMLRSIGFTQLRVSLNMKDVAIWSSIKQEMGLDYPFARTFTLTLNAAF
ncbi:MAG: SusC/RagA family TonB-linked outer membrane protein [Odoribacteraceae bacterium]|nr:SusC/RagA family TonB-linked outer membrane protein [Odoribacteraceae bacterium]